MLGTEFCHAVFFGLVGWVDGWVFFVVMAVIAVVVNAAAAAAAASHLKKDGDSQDRDALSLSLIRITCCHNLVHEVLIIQALQT